MFQSTVQHLLDSDWHSVIAEQLQAYPTAAALVIEPAILGQYDSEQGRPCDPTAHGYRRLADVEAYCIAYHDTTALWAQMIAAKNDEVDAERAWYDGELQELVDGMEDEIYWSRGMW